MGHAWSSGRRSLGVPRKPREGTKQEQVLAYQFQGTRYDCGSKIGYLKATIAYAMAHPDVSEEFIAHLRLVAATLPAEERSRAAA